MRLFLYKKVGKINIIITIFALMFIWVFSGWPQIWQNPPIPPNIQKTEARVESLKLKNKTIDFTHTDDNVNETLIIKTDQKTYIGLARGEVYFSVTNINNRAEAVNFQVYFPHDNGNVKQIAKWTEDIAYEINVLEYGEMTYFCEEGWQEDTSEDFSNQYGCQSIGLIKNCDSLIEDGTECILDQVQVDSHQETRYRDDWQDIDLSNNPLSIERGFWDKLFGKEIIKKFIPDNLRVKKSSVGEGNIIEPKQTQYFKMNIEFLPNTSGEFYIEAIGDKEGYGLLDPWWNASWDYRKSITIDHDRVGIISDLASNASSDQADVVVDDGSLFSVDDVVVIKDDSNDEIKTVSSISSNTLTMTANLTYSYTTAANAFVKNTTDSVNLSNFPVLIDLTSDTDLTTDAQDDGDDIAFTASDEVTQLDHEIEDFNGTTGELQAWVEVPTLSTGSDTVIYMYYGHSTCDSQEDITGVWDSNHKLVHHLKDLTTSTTEDSTTNSNDGTKKAANEPIETTSGQIAQAQTFDGSNDYVKVTNNVTPSPSSLTISAWIKKESGGGTYECALHKASAATIGSSDYWLGVDISDKLTATIGANTGVGWAAGQTTSVATYGTWYHLTASWNGTVVKVYINGEYNKQYNLSTYGNLITPTRFGAANDGTTYQFKGVVDEMRISDTSRGADWIKTSYNNQNLPTSFYSLGSEEDVPEIEILEQLHYHWRNDDGSESAATSATSGTQDTALSLAASTRKRLRVEISNEGTAISSNATYRLEYGEKSSTCGDISSWVDVGAGGGDWDMSASTNLTDGNNTTNIATNIGGMTDENTTFETPNTAIKDTSSQTAAISLATTEFLEAEYSIIANSSAIGKNYCFRLTNAGSITNFIYDTYPEANIPKAEQVHYRWRNDDGGEGDPSADWYNESWSYRKKITIDHTKVEDDHSSFPVLVHIDSSETDFWSHCTNKSEVVFTTSDGETKLKREVETFNHTTDDLYAWVKIPTMDKDDDLDIFIYYGNGSASETDDTDTWNTNYKLVYHLQETTGSSTDATINDNDGDVYGGVNQNVSGKISGADSFDGASGTYTDTTMSYDLSGNGAFSVFTWMKDISSGNQYAMSQAHILSGYSSDWILGYQNNGLWFRSQTIDGGNVFGDDDWHYYGFIFDGTDAKLYIDGAQHGSSVTPTGYGAVSTVKLMTRGDGTSGFAAGSLDEIHISNTNRSPAWIETSYNNQDSPAGFYSIGNEQSEAGATWAANEDTALTGFTKTTPKRLRIGISNEGEAVTSNYQYRLEVSEPNPSTCVAGSYERVSTDADWEMVASSYVTEGQATGDVVPGLSNENTTFVAGEVREVADQTGAISLTSTEFTELEYSIQATASATGEATYCFRLTDVGSTDNFIYSESTYGKVTLSDIISVILNTDGTVAFGFVSLNGEENTLASGVDDTEIVKNNGGATENFNIKTSNATGGTQWSVGASANEDVCVVSFSTNDGGAWEVLQTVDDYETLATGVLEDGTVDLDLKIGTPTITTDYNQKSITITIQAVAP